MGAEAPLPHKKNRYMMKKTAVILAMFFGISLLQSCEDDKDLYLNMDDAVAPAIVSPESGDSFTLLEDEMEEIAVTLAWDHAQYPATGLPDTRYLIQMDLTENNFEDSNEIVDITDTRDNTYEFTVAALNTRLVSNYGAEDGETLDISFRIFAFLTRDSDDTWLYSEPVEISVTAFELDLDPDILNVPGSYQGWEPDNMQTVVYSPEQDDLYEGYFYFEEENTEYKFAMGSWDDNWGDDDADGTLQPDGENIVAETPGVYKVNADFNEMTHENMLTEWAVIGDAAEGWDTDVFMEIDLDYWEQNQKVRYSITLEMQEGFFKFRANEAWDPPAGLNLGIDEEAEEGVLMYGGFENDIPIDAAGEYTIILDLSGPEYRYEIHQE